MGKLKYIFVHTEPLNWVELSGQLHASASLPSWEIVEMSVINLLTPNVNYSGRTAPLTSKVAFYIFIQQI